MISLENSENQNPEIATNTSELALEWKCSFQFASMLPWSLSGHFDKWNKKKTCL